MKQWETIQETPGSLRVHVHPLQDALTHEITGDDCVCGPAYEMVPNDNAPDGWVIVHNALDGRKT